MLRRPLVRTRSHRNSTSKEITYHNSSFPLRKSRKLPILKVDLRSFSNYLKIRNKLVKIALCLRRSALSKLRESFSIV